MSEDRANWVLVRFLGTLGNCMFMWLWYSLWCAIMSLTVWNIMYAIEHPCTQHWRCVFVWHFLNMWHFTLSMCVSCFKFLVSEGLPLIKCWHTLCSAVAVFDLVAIRLTCLEGLFSTGFLVGGLNTCTHWPDVSGNLWTCIVQCLSCASWVVLVPVYFLISFSVRLTSQTANCLQFTCGAWWCGLIVVWVWDGAWAMVAL